MQDNKSKEEVKQVKEETVSVPKNVWDDMVKTVSMLKETADVGRVSKYEAKHKEKSKLVVGLIDIGGKVAVSYRMGQDDGVTQTIKLTLEDGKEVELPYQELTKVKKVKGVVTSRKTVDDETTLTVELPDGHRIQMSEEFVNAI